LSTHIFNRRWTNVRTDLIAAEAANTKRATFFLSMTVPKAVGTTRAGAFSLY
jgi:hypothetical protein